MAKSKSIEDRGKWAEGKVHDFLKSFNKFSSTFDFQRMPDARAARGALAKQVADFEIFDGYHGVVEVKETEHDYRIPKAKISQIPRMRKRANAGGKIIVVVYHSNIDKWRMPSAEFLLAEHVGASWDLSDFLLFDTAEAALKTHPCFQ